MNKSASANKNAKPQKANINILEKCIYVLVRLKTYL
jgi:hypothetical protein